MNATFANSLWLASCLPEHARFHRAVRDTAAAQQTVLMRILQANAATIFGHAHRFSSITTPIQYQRQVPIRDHAAHLPWLAPALDGSLNQLTAEPILLAEPTSGSTTATKLIPYTRSLQAEFQRGIETWIADLFLHQPDLLRGPAFWSVSPVLQQQTRTAGNIPVGFQDDTAYLGPFRARLVASVLAVPPAVRHAPDLDAFHLQTLQRLLAAADLRILSVWNPTFLTLLLDRLPQLADRLLPTLPSHRAKQVEQALAAKNPYPLLWPRLGLLSCWADANAALPAAQLAAQFPQGHLQAKGLLATEAFVTLPLRATAAPALALRSHFFEFLPVGGQVPILAHQLVAGSCYTVLVTTGGGLYRYPLGDLVEVTGHLHTCPLLRFLGRQNLTSDWFGEKLTEAHTVKALHHVFAQLELSPRFAMLALDPDPNPAYTLYLDDRGFSPPALAPLLEDELKQNFHYAYARRLGQLAAVRVIDIPDAATLYFAYLGQQGRKAGNIKPPALDPGNHWTSTFRARVT